MANPEQEKQDIEKQIDKILSEIKEQDDRLSKLKSSGFELASYYLVFQGVILTAIKGANTVFRCLPYWLLIVLSASAALPNLFAMFKIGRKYIQIKYQRSQSRLKSDKLNARSNELAAVGEGAAAGDVPGAGAGAGEVARAAEGAVGRAAVGAAAGSRAGAGTVAGAATGAGTEAVAGAAAGDGAGMEEGTREGVMLRVFFFVFGKADVLDALFIVCGMIFNIFVFGIMYLVCVKTLRKPGAQCKN